MPTIVKELELESRKKRLIISWISVFSIVICLVISISTFVHADDWSGLIEAIDQLCGPDAVTAEAAPLLGQLLSGSLITYGFEQFYSADIMTTIMDSVTGQTQTFMTSLTTVLKVIGTLLCLFHAITKMLEEMQRGEMTMESYLRVIIAFVIPLVIIIEYDYFLDAFMKIGIWLHQITQVDNTETVNAITDIYAGKGVERPSFPLTVLGFVRMFEDLFLYIIAFSHSAGVVMAAIIVNGIVLFMVLTGILSNYIEIILRHLFMPIALAHITHEGVRSPGVRYIKKYLGCFLKIATITVAVDSVFYVYNTVISTIDETQINSLQVWLFFILIAPVTKQALKMTNEIITDAMGE